eukprot:2925081-Amphidinium_carterae.1
MVDDDMYAAPGFTGKSPPRSPVHQNQQKGSKKSPRGSNSPKEKPRKSSTSPRDEKGSKSDGDKNICRMWKTTGTCKFGDKCKYSHDVAVAAVAETSEGEVSMIAALHGSLDEAEAYRNPVKTETLICSAIGL